MSEHTEQATLFECIDRYKSRYPDLALIFAIPNGAKRDRVTGAQLKQEGVKAGVPDIFVAVQRYHSAFGGRGPTLWGGLFIEMKIHPNKPTLKQIEWHMELLAREYAVAVCYGWLEAWQTICTYLDIPLEVSA